MTLLLNKGRCAGVPFYLSLCLGFLLCVHARAQEERMPPVPEGEGKQLFVTVCSQCHTLKSTLILRDGQQGWERTVDRMVLYGAQLSPSEANTLTHYLVTQLGPGSPRPESAPARSGSPHGGRANTSRVITLPDGPGKDLVATRCALCHTLETVVSVKRSRADWEATIVDMQERGMKTTPDEMREIIAYLQANFSTTKPISLPMSK